MSSIASCEKALKGLVGVIKKCGVRTCVFSTHRTALPSFIPSSEKRGVSGQRNSRPFSRKVLYQLLSTAAVAEGVTNELSVPISRDDIRNIAIIAHVDHGKTTLVDSMLRQSRVFRDDQEFSERIMDSFDLERERGITIFSKNTAVTYKNYKINIIDTPGHADFGGEVERVLNMCDGVLLLVDSVEGPMPQTRFVLKKALELNKKIVLVVNKIDRDSARPDYVVDATFELFLELGASDEQCSFPVVYASGIRGIAGDDPKTLAQDLEPLFKAITKEISAPKVRLNSPLQMLVTNIDFQEHKGRIAIGRITAGSIKRAQNVGICRGTVESMRPGKISELFVYQDFKQVPVEEVDAGDICAVAGIADIKIGETLTDMSSPCPLPMIQVEEPTVTMTFLVNTSPFAGKEGKYVTTRNIKERLDRELERNLALRVTKGPTADAFIVSGRGGLHLGILIETMRREGYEFAVGPMTVIMKEINGEMCEPFEEATIEVPEEYVGAVVDVLGRRKGKMLDMSPGLGSTNILKYTLPTRGLLGLRSNLLTVSKGNAIMHTIFSGYEPYCGEIFTRDNGSLVAFETGSVTTYALESMQSRGIFIVKPSEEVYEGQVIGMNTRGEDLRINICKKKHLTNVRSANKEATVVLDKVKEFTLDEALEYIAKDELVEVTPKSVRIRKMKLNKTS